MDVFDPLDNTVMVSPDESFQIAGQEHCSGAFEGEGTENEKMDVGFGDGTLSMQTPVRNRIYEVDSKTITRPKKTSPLSVPLPEVFNQTVDSPQPLTHPIASSTPVQMSTASSSSPASAAVLSPSQSAAVGVTPARSTAAATPAAPGTYTKSTAAPVPRAARQQTVVVTSALTTSVRAVLEEEKASGLDGVTATRLEARILALVQDKEREWMAKNEKLGKIMVDAKNDADSKIEQLEMDVFTLTVALNDANKAIEAGFPPGHGGRAPSGSSSLPHLPPPAAIAQMSADKLAELARVKKEMASLESENNKLHMQYNSLYDTYSQQRTIIPALKTKCEALEKGIEQERSRFDKLKRHAEAKLDEATAENDALRSQMNNEKKEHQDNTISIRMRLKQREAEIDELQQSIIQKKKQNAELKEICDELIRKADMNCSDIE